jgi:hypothetical protein
MIDFHHYPMKINIDSRVTVFDILLMMSLNTSDDDDDNKLQISQDSLESCITFFRQQLVLYELRFRPTIE